MRKILLSIAVLMFISAFGFYEVSAQTKNEAALIARQKAYFDAVIKKDYAFLDALLAEDYIGGYALGSIDKARESKDLREFPLKDFQISDIKTAFPNAKTEIIVFKLHVTVVYDGKDFSEDDFLNCVWTKHGKKWLLSAQSAVKVAKNS
jgi:ketosteroid isomerase-like protein